MNIKEDDMIWARRTSRLQGMVAFIRTLQNLPEEARKTVEYHIAADAAETSK